MKLALALFSAPLMLAGGALAQETTPAKPSSPQPEAGATAQAEPAGPVSEEEVSRFALAALVINHIAEVDALGQEQQQSAIAQVVQQTGLEPQRFSQIALASQTNTALQQRIETAARGHVEAARQQQQQ